MTNDALTPAAAYLAEDNSQLDDFISLVSEPTELAGSPHASSVTRGVLVYDSARLRAEIARPQGLRDVAEPS